MKRKKEFIIGLSVLATIAILVFGIEYLKGINLFQPANFYYATYSNVTGLTTSAPVTLNGYKVGAVRDIEYLYDRPGHMRVELGLDDKLRLPQGTRALLSTDLLGTASIVIALPDSAATTYYAPGDELPAAPSPSLLDGVTQSVIPAVERLMPRIDSLLTSVTALATSPALHASLQRLASVMANLETSTATLQRTLAPTPAVTQSLAVTMEDVQTLAANLNALSHELVAMPIDSTMANLNTLSANLASLSEQLASPTSSLGQLIYSPELYNNINNAVAHIDSILVDLQRRPRHYIPPIKVF